LLADDVEEAGDVVDAGIERASMLAAFDETLLPTLALAREDLRRGRIDAPMQARVVDLVHDLIQDADPRLPVDEAGHEVRFVPCEVLAAPARDADEPLRGHRRGELGHDLGADLVGGDPEALRPIDELVGAAERLGGGDFSVRTPWLPKWCVVSAARSHAAAESASSGRRLGPSTCWGVARPQRSVSVG